jgi:hypothetical protein
LDSGFYSANAPLVFIRPVGLDAADSLRLTQAAQRLSDTVRWRMAPVGVQADVYLAHRASVAHEAPTTRDSLSESLQPASTLNSSYEHSQIYVNSDGFYKNHPVCLVGAAPAHPAQIAEHLPTLQFPDALEDLRLGLSSVQEQLIGLRAMYALGNHAWQERKRWKTHRLHVIDGAQLIAVIEPVQWRVHLLSGAHISQIESGSTMLVPHSNAFAAPGFDILPMEQVLWEFAKRCPESLLEKILPSTYLRDALTHRRVTELSERELGDHCVALLRALDIRSRTADELQTALRMSRPALLRALACLALTRTIRPKTQKPFRLRRLLGWLPQRLRQHVTGLSSLQ